jgi:hypothetical protein
MAEVEKKLKVCFENTNVDANHKSRSFFNREILPLDKESIAAKESQQVSEVVVKLDSTETLVQRT